MQLIGSSVSGGSAALFDGSHVVVTHAPLNGRKKVTSLEHSHAVPARILRSVGRGCTVTMEP